MAWLELHHHTYIFQQSSLSRQSIACSASVFIVSFDKMHSSAWASSGPADGKYAGRVWCRALIRGQQSFTSGPRMVPCRVPQCYLLERNRGVLRFGPLFDFLITDTTTDIEQRASWTLNPNVSENPLSCSHFFVLSSSNLMFISGRHDSAYQPHE